MRTPTHPPLYRHTSAAVLRAASMPLTSAPGSWPDLDDAEATREWLRCTWTDERFAEAVRLASPGLADRVQVVCDGHPTSVSRMRSIALSLTRYALRTTSRPTPFGLFAGAVPVTIGDPTCARWSEERTGSARVDAQWLLDLVSRLEAIPGLLERLPVVFTNLAVRRGRHIEAPHGPDRVAVRTTRALEATREVTEVPVRFSAAVEELTGSFPGAEPETARGMLTELVRRGLLITSLRSPLTLPDPLTHLIDTLHAASAETVPEASELLAELEATYAGVHEYHNADRREQGRIRARLEQHMCRISTAGRTPLSLDLRLGCDVHLPEQVAREAERAASALMRLTREPTGPAAWREYFTAFCERYGTGTLVPVTEVVHPDAGLGFPAGYPTSPRPEPRPILTRRDERLVALAWQALAEGDEEITLTDATIDELSGGLLDVRYIPPHVEISARLHAVSAEAVDRGDFTLTVAPGRSAGTFTARFTETAPHLAAVYGQLPTLTVGALAAQVSVPPVYPHAQNICRTPVFLPHIIPLGEHRDPTPEAETENEEAEMIELEDLALTATRERLHLVSISRRQVVEPQAFHALAIEKQLPPLARFLLQVSRGGLPAWTEFDWGSHARLPYLPRVRYRRSVLSPARWRLTTSDLDLPSSPGSTNADCFRDALAAWRRRWNCPALVELRDDDRSLRLNVNEPTHAELVQAHLERHETAQLAEAGDTGESLGWIGGYAHEIALPLTAAGPPAPNPLSGPLPLLTSSTHGQLPAHAEARWLHAQLPTHPERMAEIITDHLPTLLAALGDDCPWWFVRYRSAHESDHLRLRIRTHDGQENTAHTATLAHWAHRLREAKLAGPLTLGTYHPETGRYGSGSAMEAAEDVFVADSTVVAAQLRHLSEGVVDPLALTAAGMVATVRGLLGHREAMAWLYSHPAPGGRADRAVTGQALRLAEPHATDNLPGDVTDAWEARTRALAAYHCTLPSETDLDVVIESLLHMHHNRNRGIDRDGEAVCRRLARQTAVTWQARHGGSTR